MDKEESGKHDQSQHGWCTGVVVYLEKTRRGYCDVVAQRLGGSGSDSFRSVSFEEPRERLEPKKR